MKVITLSKLSVPKDVVTVKWTVDSLKTDLISKPVTTSPMMLVAQKSHVTKLPYTVNAVMEDKCSPLKVKKKNA